jgi:cytochrome c553
VIRKFFIVCLIPGVLGGLAKPASAEDEITLSLPPASLAQWYKPRAKRQVWLHTMFGLRREMLAVSDYIALQRPEALRKWSARLAANYRKVGKMVPEWKDELDLEQLARLERAAQRADYAQAADAQRRLGHSCDSCHREYRAVVALLYRSPDFSRVRVEDSESLEEVPYKKVMQRLSILVNRIKIASEDGRRQAARDSAEALARWLDDLSGSCETCHRDDPEPTARILGAGMRAGLSDIDKALKSGNQKDLGMAVAGLAVETCARCHGIHRTLSDIRREIAP